MGADAIIVSNHGGRQCDTTVSTIDALPAIVKALGNIGSDMEVYIDGGIRRGTDILKCIALGAKAVLVGRPIIWGLAVNGKEGVKDILSILRSEFEVAMKLCGYPSLASVRESKDLLK
jgi:4-hydroxymandelate oxidase